MKKAVFKTNINCGSCVAKVTPYLDQAESVEGWEVDTANKEKLLSVRGAQIDQTEVENLVKEAGYEIEMKRRGLGRFFG